MFFRCRAPVEPVSFVHAICEDASMADRKRSRHVKRLTPISFTGKATERGLEEVAQQVLAPHFHQAGSGSKKVCTWTRVMLRSCVSYYIPSKAVARSLCMRSLCMPCNIGTFVIGRPARFANICWEQFAIRPNIRNHNILTRDFVIQNVASAVGPGHKVDLKNYDVLILVEIYKVRRPSLA